MASADEHAADLAARQGGVFSRVQLLNSGVPASTIDRRVNVGQWHRIAAGVFCLRGTPLGSQSLCRAAQLLMEGLVVARETAARLHHFTHLEPTSADTVELLTSGRARPAGPWRIRSTTHLPSHHITTAEGLSVTTRERTLIDLAACTRSGRFERMLDDELVGGRTTVPRLQAVLDDLAGHGRRGSPAMRQLLAERADGSAIPTSELERRFLELIARSALPTPVSQFLTPWNQDLGVGRVDFAYPDRRLIIEVDGRRWHGNRFAFEADRRRDQLATAAGWHTLRFTWSQVVDDPSHVVNVIATTLARAA